MKKKVFCVFVLILWFLLFSTAFSFWVEQAMVPEVVLTHSDPSKSSDGYDRLSLDCLKANDGEPSLYFVMEGSGWEEGDRAWKIEDSEYSVSEEGIELLYDHRGDMIRYSTKPIRSGDPVSRVNRQGTFEDCWLAVSGGEELSLRDEAKEACQVLAQNGNALLLSVKEASRPFMPDEAESTLFGASVFGTGQRKLYSLAELEEFTGALRSLALLPGLALTVFILWAASFALIKDVKKNRKKLVINGVLAVLALAAIWVVLQKASLPSSLLPRTSIMELSHYGSEFSEIFSSLKSFAAAGNEVAAKAVSGASASLWTALAVVLFCCAAGGFIAAAETLSGGNRKQVYRHAKSP